MNQETYELGKQHYWEGLDVSAMDSAEPSSRVAWLCGYLDAMGEHRMLNDHKLIGTGAVFYQSTGLLQCALCHGWQLIRKPIS